MNDVFEQMLKENQFIVLGFDTDTFLPLKVYKRQKVIMDYFPSQFTSNFYPLAPFGSPSTPGVTLSYYASKISLQLKQIANVTNIFNMNVSDYPTNELLQVRMGIAPSPLRVFNYYPSNEPLGDISTNIAWSQTTGLLNFGYVDGFASPLNAPTEAGELLFIPKVEPVFSFMNPTATVITPLLRFFINQLIVEPVNDPAMVKKIFDRLVPAKIVTLGTFSKGLTMPQQIFPTAKGHFVTPISLDATLQEITSAGFREGF